MPSTTPGAARPLDLAALSASVDDQTLNAFIADSKATGQPWSRVTTGTPRPGVSAVIEMLIPVVIPTIGVIALLSVGGRSLIGAIWDFTTSAPFPLNLVVVGVGAMIGLGILFAALRIVKVVRLLIVPRSWWLAAFRLTRFAAANGLRYGHDDAVPYPGVIFGTGSDRVAERRLTSTAGRRVDIGNYRYTVTHDDAEPDVYHWGYVAITLDRRLPHLLLDAKGNDRSMLGIRTSNLPVDLARDQRLSLGGEFDEKFTLYAPSDYGRDAFQIFAPDLMALFIDRLGAMDVEIVDDTMFVYGPSFDLLDPQVYGWLQELVATVVARTVRRTERYSDDFAALQADPRLAQPTGQFPTPTAAAAPGAFAFAGTEPPHAATNTVAEGGRRLRSRRWGPAAIFGLLLLAFWIYDGFVAPLFGLPHTGK